MDDFSWFPRYFAKKMKTIDQLLKNTDKQKKVPHEKFMRIKNAEERLRTKERLKAIRDKAVREGRLNMIDIRKMDDRQVV